jgi:lipid-binding SYLF domain-containing protein
MKNLMRTAILTVSLALASLAGGAHPVRAGAVAIDQSVDAALASLYAGNPAARALGNRAWAVLVFPDVVKGGFIFGGLYGEGALRSNGKTIGYYSTAALSYGLQAGVQKYGYALFLMSRSAIDYLDSSDGWELGIGPSIVLVDEGVARTLTTTTAQDDVYAFIFDQKGLMAGLGLQGSKITKIDPGR